MAEVNLIVIRKTQELLGKYVKRPALSEKLLKKPPFRFLHDVINVVIKDTGYLEGVYTEQELQFENVKDKEAKIDFLQKLIDAVKDTSSDKIKVKPSKIVAGLEPERTNELLQAIGKAVDALKGNNNNNDVESKNISAAINPVSEARAKPKKMSQNSGEVKSKNPTKVDQKTTVKKSSIQGVTNSTSTSSIIKTNKGAKPIKTVEVKEKTTSGNKSLKVKTAPKDVETTTLQRSGTETILRETGLGKEPMEEVMPSNHQSPVKDFVPVEVLDSKGIAGDSNNNSVKADTSFLTEVFKDNDKIETNDTNLTQVLSNTSNNIKKADDDEPFGTIVPFAVNSDLIDVIDQEAEIRRRERSSRKHRERRKSSGHTTGLDEHANSVAVDMPTTVQENALPKSSKPKKSLKIQSSISDHNFEEVDKKPMILQKSSEEPPTPLVRPRTSLRPPSVRPASARPGAPRRRDKNVEIFLQPDDAVQMAGISVKVDKFPEVNLDDDGDNLIVIEDPLIGVVDDSMKSEFVVNDFEDSKSNSAGGIHDVNSDQHGHLVQQILQTQKDLVKADENDLNNGLEKDFTTNRQRQSSAKQMDMLRDSIQTLTRSVNPLGKLMDFLQEDIDSMQMELAAWRRTYFTAKADLKRESSLNETAVQPLKQQLAQIEITIRDHIELTNASRLNILQNEEKIFQLLSEI